MRFGCNVSDITRTRVQNSCIRPLPLHYADMLTLHIYKPFVTDPSTTVARTPTHYDSFAGLHTFYLMCPSGFWMSSPSQHSSAVDFG